MPLDVSEAATTTPPPPASPCSSSSIGKDSDECAPPPGEEEGGEVQSAYVDEKGGTGAVGGGLVGLEALEEALPIRRSISKFYSGKSKSFACLKQVIKSSGSTKDISKEENVYSRKRKNLLAYSLMYHNHNSNETAAAFEVYETGPPKRPASLSRSSLGTMASSSSRSSSTFSIEDNDWPEQLHCPRSPDICENYGPPKIPTPRPGSCTSNVPSTPLRSLSMVDLSGLHSSNSLVRLKDRDDGDY